ncbi:uncharacterized protein LTR77_001528 [Saxophila tyrrhenica]|uniref:Uncharacterized protein n=1 Tax=Saxophila tyrrhenica TaxID=1690608 RepID=A0AAV9PKQ5_9PEZI|nr:hypothetical protein LTR77_001528 [Saxophila tyrrhenica]
MVSSTPQINDRFEFETSSCEVERWRMGIEGIERIRHQPPPSVTLRNNGVVLQDAAPAVPESMDLISPATVDCVSGIFSNFETPGLVVTQRERRASMSTSASQIAQAGAPVLSQEDTTEAEEGVMEDAPLRRSWKPVDSTSIKSSGSKRKRSPGGGTRENIFRKASRGAKQAISDMAAFVKRDSGYASLPSSPLNKTPATPSSLLGVSFPKEEVAQSPPGGFGNAVLKPPPPGLVLAESWSEEPSSEESSSEEPSPATSTSEERRPKRNLIGIKARDSVEHMRDMGLQLHRVDANVELPTTRGRGKSLFTRSIIPPECAINPEAYAYAMAACEKKDGLMLARLRRMSKSFFGRRSAPPVAREQNVDHEDPKVRNQFADVLEKSLKDVETEREKRFRAMDGNRTSEATQQRAAESYRAEASERRERFAEAGVLDPDEEEREDFRGRRLRSRQADLYRHL